jgi:Large polyvalent protein associated domain 23
MPEPDMMEMGRLLQGRQPDKSVLHDYVQFPGVDDSKTGMLGKFWYGNSSLAAPEAKQRADDTSWGQAAMNTMGGLHPLKMLDGALTSGRDFLQSDPMGNPEDAGPKAFGVAANVGTLGMGAARPANSVGMFGGRLAKTADHAAMAAAERDLAAGVPREKVWQDHGWFKGGDGKMRFELDDSQARIGNKPKVGDLEELPEAIKHKQLYDAYPELQRYSVEGLRYGGEHRAGTQQFGAGVGNGFMSTSLHEIQHALQHKEGFANGGHPQYRAMEIGRTHPDVLAAERKHQSLAESATDALQMGKQYTAEAEANKPSWYSLPSTRAKFTDALQKSRASVDRASRLTDMRQEALTDISAKRKEVMSSPATQYDAHDWYNRLAGETEARTVEARRDLTPEQRRARAPWLDYDVPEANQIVRFGGGGTQASIPEKPPIRAYHGSPHDFDKFDTAKIGTGEGAQAFGYGHYFAENEGVATSYRDALAGLGKHPDFPAPPGSFADRLAEAFGGDGKTWDRGNRNISDYAKKFADHNGIDQNSGLRYSQFKDGSKFIDGENYWSTASKELKPGEGHMYEVGIKADPDHFLDWDKPINQQPDKVRAAIPEKWNPSWDVEGDSWKAHTKSPEFMKQMQESGVPGIKYLDQGSRGAGTGSRNYVVFDPSIIEIMRKYGIVPGMMGGAAALGGGGHEPEPAQYKKLLAEGGT